jgi:cephalosporin-C deacetylase-like acetyl esterase
MKHFLTAAVLLLVLCAGAAEYDLVVKSDKKHWALKAGEKVTFSFQLLSRDNAKAPWQIVKGRTVTYWLMGDGGMKEQKGRFVTAEKPFELTASLNGPGWLCINFIPRDEKGKYIKSGKNQKILQKGIGVLYDPEKIQPGQVEPADFDAFWKAQRELLNKVPLKAKLTPFPAPAQFKGKYKFWDVQVDCAGGKPVSGYLCIPVGAKPKSLPAIVTYHGAGVRGAHAYPFGNSVHLDINAHGLPNGREAAFYEKLNKTTLKGYRHEGNDNRDTIYFRGMFLRVMRALDYVKTRPEWNGKVLVACGGSQGGGQAIAAAALDPQVTLCIATVPAIGDHAGSIAKFPRRPGWPRFYDARTAEPSPKVIEATAYFDNLFFAKRIKCETYLTTGLMDTSCSPAGVYLAYRNIAAKKKYIAVYPSGNPSGAPNHKGNARLKDVLK